MNETITMPDSSTYQIMRGEPRRVYGARDRIQRESHALVVETTAGATAKHEPTAWWATDLRRGRRSIYGGLLRFLDHLHRRGYGLELALRVPEWLAYYCVELWMGEPGWTVKIVVQREEQAPAVTQHRAA